MARGVEDGALREDKVHRLMAEHATFPLLWGGGGVGRGARVATQKARQTMRRRPSVSADIGVFSFSPVAVQSDVQRFPRRVPAGDNFREKSNTL